MALVPRPPNLNPLMPTQAHQYGGLANEQDSVAPPFITPLFTAKNRTGALTRTSSALLIVVPCEEMLQAS